METRDRVEALAEFMIKKYGLINLSRSDLCKAAKIPNGSFVHIMGCTFEEFINKLKVGDVDTTLRQVSKSRTHPDLRRNNILHTAIKLSKSHGYILLTREMIAKEAGISVALVTRYFGTMSKLKAEVMTYAIDNEILSIISQGLANRDEQVISASVDIKTKAANYLISR